MIHCQIFSCKIYFHWKLFNSFIESLVTKRYFRNVSFKPQKKKKKQILPFPKAISFECFIPILNISSFQPKILNPFFFLYSFVNFKHSRPIFLRRSSGEFPRNEGIDSMISFSLNFSKSFN